MRCVIILMLTSVVGNSTPLVVTQGRAAQKAGTRLVDVYYDLSGGVPPYTVTLQGSSDGGASWTMPMTSVSGMVGTVTTAGTNRLVTWDAGTDWAGQVTSNLKFRVTVTDSATPSPYGGMVRITGGDFQMGDQSNPLVGLSDGRELPVHLVYVSTFYIAKYEVSKELWDSVRDWGLVNGYTDLPEGYGKAANHPVQSISWYSMVKWCNARSEMENLVPCYYTNAALTTATTYKTGSVNIDNTMVKWNASGYRLPTEAEWEKAARGGQPGKNFPWGDTISQDQANYMVYSLNGITNFYSYDVTGRPPATGTHFSHPSYKVGSTASTAPVDSFTPNGFGLFNMSGNVWEWCWDRYLITYYAASPRTDPRGPAADLTRVFRGGDCVNGAGHSRVAWRSGHDTAFFSSALGFRPARNSPP